MLVLIICTILVIIIISILTSAFYLISLIVEESDDANADALIIESDRSDYSGNQNNVASTDNVDETSHQLTSAPSASPKDEFNQKPGPWEVPVTDQKNLISSKLGPAVSKLIFDDFDNKETNLGGTGLHWCKSRKTIDLLIKLDIPINLTNNNKETALHVAVRKRRLPIVIGLLCHGADVGCTNQLGETPLLVATKISDIFICQLLLVFDSNVNVKDNNGLSARHYAANLCDRNKVIQQQVSTPHLILSMLDELGAKRCVNNLSMGKTDESSSVKTGNTSPPCTDGCSNLGKYNGNSYNKWPSFDKESLYKRHMFTDLIAKQKRRNLKESQMRYGTSKVATNPDTKRSRLLCVDGGGMRGVIVCQILIEMEKYLKKPMIDYFDWIGGTSVGAFLSCALSTGTSIYELRRICFDVKDEVFNGNKPYNAKFLERVLKRTYSPTAKLSDIKDKKIAVTTVLADRDPCQLRFFRNYKSPVELLESHGYSVDEFNNMSSYSVIHRRNNSTTSGKSYNNHRAEDKPKSDRKSDVLDEDERDPFIWQAVRASAAAPFFFKPYGPYLDGGMISNNPTLDMLTEFFSHESVKKFLQTRFSGRQDAHTIEHENELKEPPSVMDLVVSLGTGRGRIIGRQNVIDFGNVATGFSTVFSPVELLRSIRGARDLFKKLMQQSCHTDDHILDRAQAWCASLNTPYYRINPPLATIFSIDDKRDEQLIFALWQTKLYMRSIRDQLRELGELLDGRVDFIPESDEELSDIQGQTSPAKSDEDDYDDDF